MSPRLSIGIDRMDFHAIGNNTALNIDCTISNNLKSTYTGRRERSTRIRYTRLLHFYTVTCAKEKRAATASSALDDHDEHFSS